MAGSGLAGVQTLVDDRWKPPRVGDTHSIRSSRPANMDCDATHFSATSLSVWSTVHLGYLGIAQANFQPVSADNEHTHTVWCAAEEFGAMCGNE